MGRALAAFLLIASVAVPASLCAQSAPASPAGPTLAVSAGGASLQGGELHLDVTIEGVPADHPLDLHVLVDGREVNRLALAEGQHAVPVSDPSLGYGGHSVTLVAGELRAETSVRVIPGWLSVLPPIIAIGLALAFRDVLLSLFIGVFSGAFILAGWNPVSAFARSIDSYIAPALAEPSHARILIFSSLLGGMVGVISKSGGTRGVVERLIGFASSPRRGQLATWAMGVAIFFDDYANTLIVGSTMRPITDRLRVSREKLAYMVDSTAAPVASLFPISTWIGFEVGLIGGSFADLGLHFNPYTTFIATIPYRFYPIFALVLGFAIAATGRDFGPMYRAEHRARVHGELLASGDKALADYTKDVLEPPEGVPHRATNAVLPILVVVGVTLAGLYTSGSADLVRNPDSGLVTWLRDVFAASDPYNSLLWASLSGVVTAVVLPLVQRLVSVRETMEALVEGFKSMILALVVLVLAWSISGVCTNLHTAEYLVGITQEVLSPHWLPVLVFLLSAATSFATGTSWGTMGILMPLVIPIANGLSIAGGHPIEDPMYYILMLGTISSVLAGSVWGDHCSPISDTTIMSSMASGCDHIAHVRTQIPYAVAIGFVGMLTGDIPTAYGLSPWVSLAVGSLIIIGGLVWLGKRVDAPDPPAP